MDIDVWIDTILASLRELANAWTVYQAAIVIACGVLAVGLTRLIEPKIDARLRRITGQPRLLRVLVVITRRMGWILLVVGLWASIGILRELTASANFYLLLIAARLATAWAAISIPSRLIQSLSLIHI